MVRIREIPRTAAFAWSPGAAPPFIATGTRAGAVNDSFSDDTSLELWDLSLDTAGQGVELQPTASVSSDSRFHDVAWHQPKDGKEKGIIAGALENGSLDLWDAAKLLNNDSDSKISSTQKHTGPIKSVQFNPFRSELLATAGAKEELYISDLNNIANPFKLGNTAATATDFECVEWNKKVAHIMATGSSGGFVTVWDVKSKKQNVTLNNYGRKPVSAIAWDPEKSTRLATAVPLETDPVILIWDLRNANAPEKILTGHQGGVLSLAWCQQDPDLLLSCGKDNRTLVWNPQTGEQYGEFPVVTNWTFQTRWNPHNPGLLATASFDGKIGIETLQSTKKEVTDSAGAPVSDEDFFDNTSNQPLGSAFNLKKAPKWLQRPAGASFGFGGKVVNFKPDSSGRKSVIKLTKFTVDDDVGNLAETFETSLADKNLAGLCEKRVSEAKTEGEKADWKVMETLVSSNPRKEIVNYLGFAENAEAPAADANGDAAAATKADDDDDGFFDKGGDDDGFLADIGSTKGAKTNNPFHLFADSESEADKKITKAIMLGQFDKAMEVCLAEDRISDAFMIATCGGPKSIEKAQKAYFKKQGSGPSYTRLLASVVGKNLWDVVYNADLANWKETMVAICTYADAQEFPDLCEALGDRLEEQLAQDPNDITLRQNAAFCYITGRKLEKVVGLWLTDLTENEKKGLEDATEGTAFSIHARSLQGFVEKVTVFREVTKYQDSDLQAPSGWKLADLYDKYLEYADIAASHGKLAIAKKYLDLLPTQYANADVARNRVLLATQKTPITTASRQPAAAARAPANIVPTFETTPAPQQPQQRPNPYGPPQPSGPYAPAGAPAAQAPGPSTYAPAGNPYGPGAGYAPSQPVQQPGRPYGMPAPNTFGAPVGPPGPGNYGGPPRGASPAVAPPSQAKNMVNWNDTPDDFFKPISASRRGTPAQGAPAPAPYGSAPPPLASPPIAGGVPPPPKGSATGPPPRGPPRVGTPSSAYTPQPERQGSVSAATSAYAPQQPAQQPQSSIPPPMAPPIARGPSPYQAAPPAAGGAGSNRYAPSPAAQAAPQAPPAAAPPPANPYAPRQSSLASAQYSAPGTAAPPPRAGPPPGAPPQGPPRSTASPAQVVAPQRAAPPAAQYPSGDREHIPANARPIYDLLSEDMARIKAKAPANFKPQVLDTEKRLNILFDNLNNSTLLKPNTVEDMSQLAQALKAKNYEQAGSIQVNIMTHRTEECGQWMVGVKRLIAMSRATP